MLTIEKFRDIFFFPNVPKKSVPSAAGGALQKEHDTLRKDVSPTYINLPVLFFYI